MPQDQFDWSYKGQGIRARIGYWLRCLADRIDDENAPRVMSWLSFTFEEGIGIVFRADQHGCPLMYPGRRAYGRAHRSGSVPESNVDRWIPFYALNGSELSAAHKAARRKFMINAR